MRIPSYVGMERLVEAKVDKCAGRKEHPCPFYNACADRLGDDDELGIECTPEGFIKCDDGWLCLAWDVVVK